VRRLPGSLIVIVLIASACSGQAPEAVGKPVRQADATCDSSEEGGFYAENATYRDPDVMELELSDPSAAGFDESLLRDATRAISASKSVLSFLVLRDDKLVWERYFNGSEAAHAENIHSASKSILSLAVGKAIEEGRLALEDPISEHLPSEIVPAGARDITVEDLVTMSAGLEWKENETEFDIEDEDSIVNAILSQRRSDPPGEEFRYNTGLTQVLSAILSEATGRSTCEFVNDEVLEPIGVTTEHWLTHHDGWDAGGHSTFMTPRELARVGRLVIDGGEDVIGADWLEASMRQRWSQGCRAPSQDAGYGYLWWRSDLGGIETWEAQGYGGQSLVIVPSLDLVVVMTHDTFREPSGREPPGDAVPVMEVLANHVIPAAGGDLDPDHRCAAFDVHRTELDGRASRRLTDHVSQDMWGSPSPDGSRIVFHTRRDLNWEIYIMDADGSHQRRLTDDPGVDSFARWSPDGNRILFSRDAGRRSGLYTMEPDGSDVRRLTRGPDRTNAWSPDGRTIAFDRTDEDGEDGTLWLVDADGSNERRLEEGFLGTEPDWSPDGLRIAFWTRNGKEHVYTADARGGKRTRIAEGRDPHWLPDGSLLFAAPDGRGGTWRIVRWEGGRSTTVVDTPGDDLLPIPSADGTWLTFASAPATAAGGSGVER
jgi:CubicO group peptidase (beta-lactamase class C family)/Tol biopolymer transport system component